MVQVSRELNAVKMAWAMGHMDSAHLALLGQKVCTPGATEVNHITQTTTRQFPNMMLPASN
jgi:hypothetical protein